ncbi:PilZ domain-containing protein [bacterium]|nr:PilZ domain-containing protein [bacterium]
MKAISGKKVFTTGEVARLLDININTVIRWFDEGIIKGFRLPFSNDRRIPINSLRTFMIEQSIPMDLLERETPMRRSHERLRFKSPLRFTIANGTQYGPYQGELADLSYGGARIMMHGSATLSIPTKAYRLTLAFDDGPLQGSNLSGNIVHLHSGDAGLSLGLKFDEIPQLERGRLKSVLVDTPEN